MNPNQPKLFQYNQSGIGCFLTVLLMGLLLGSVGLGWVVNGFLILIVLLLLVPAIAFWGLRWWLQRNLVEAQCPVCNYQFTGFNGAQCECPNCGEPLKVKSGNFHRITPPGTIDVTAIEVSNQSLED